jgi:hypothetical protein
MSYRGIKPWESPRYRGKATFLKPWEIIYDSSISGISENRVYMISKRIRAYIYGKIKIKDEIKKSESAL